MKFLRKLLLPLALIAALPAARAETLGTLNTVLSHTQVLTYPQGLFSDFVSFTIEHDDTQALLGVTGLLTNGTWGVYAAADFGSLLAGTWTFGVTGRQVPLDAGTYYVGYQGGSLTDKGIVVTGGIALVPEPESYAMLLVGIGMLGLIARRRRSHGF